MNQETQPVSVESINLEQALIDFEIANARVVDLTGRVTTMSAELMQVRSETTDLRLRLRREELAHQQLAAEYNAVRATLSFRILRLLGRLSARAVNR